MQKSGSVREWRRVVCTVAAALLTACGGGGGGGNGPDNTTPVRISFDPGSVSASSLEGFGSVVDFRGSFDPGGRTTAYIFVTEARGLVIDGDLFVGATGLSGTLRLSETLAPGTYTTDVTFHACADDQCARELPGSPFLLPLRYKVLPQIKVQAPQTMVRTGREAAPSQSLQVQLPPRAGTVDLAVQGHPDAFVVTLSGDQLLVQTRQLPAGIYTTHVTLTGRADSRYHAEVDLRYEVLPPPEGEQPLVVTPSTFDLRLPQATQATYRFKVQRPTWTDVLEPVRLDRSDFGVVRDLRSLGNDEYEFSVDTSNLAPGAPPNSGQSGYFASIVASAGEFGGVAGVSISVEVGAPVSVGSPSLGVVVDATSTAAELERSTTVSAADGAAVPWTARASQPWLQLLRSAGTTGVDTLSYRIDPSVLALEGVQQDATLTLALERPGTLPVEFPVVVRNLLPRFDMASPGVLTGTTATIYVHGRVFRDGHLLDPGVLSISGARLFSKGIYEDRRFVGPVPLLEVRLTDIVPGQPVTIRSASALLPTELVLPSTGTVQVPLGYATLPRGAYRPPSFASNGRALVFAGAGKVWRWPLGTSAWGALAQRALPGVIDAAFAPDESAIFAPVGNEMLALDSATLSTLRRGALEGRDDPTFETAVPPFAGAFAYAADGRAFASVFRPAPDAAHGAGWLAGCAPTGEIAADVTRQPCFADPGNIFETAIPGVVRGTSLTRSERGTAVVRTYPGGDVVVYQGIGSLTSPMPGVPAGQSIVAIDNAAGVTVRDDGLLRSGSRTVRLPTLLPQGFQAGGYALTGGGETVAVYAYRIASEADGPRARDARVLLLTVSAALSGNAAISGTIDLPDAVGCTAALAADETCEHRAALGFAPGNRSLFVVGPRGVAALPVPAPATAMAAPATFRKVVPATP